MNVKKIKPGKGQESVWDYPRPPRLEKVTKHLRIIHNEVVIVDTNQAFRVLETSHPPTYYLPLRDFREGVLRESLGQSYCEFKGMAHYYDIKIGGALIEKAGWGYESPNSGFEELKDTISIYAHKVHSCLVEDEEVQAQEGDFYGGWITKDIVGPFKGAPGTWGW